MLIMRVVVAVYIPRYGLCHTYLTWSKVDGHGGNCKKIVNLRYPTCRVVGTRDV